jgi:CheY-like chemotaxis protein
MATILLIDDEEQVRLIFQVTLAGAGYLVLAAEDGQHGLRLFQRQEMDLILVDIFMPEPDGMDLIPRLDATRPPSKIIAISGGSWEGDYLDKAKHLGPNDTLKKPFILQELLEAASSQLN